MSWLEKLLPSKIQQTDPADRRAVPEGLWIKCPACETVLYKTDLEQNLNVCPKCDHHHRIGARARLNGFLDAAHEALAHHRAHRAAHEFELEARRHHGHAHHGAAHHHQRVGLARGFQRGLQPRRILLAVLELQGIDGHHFLADFPAALGVEERVEPGARADAQVVVALGADVEVLLEVGLVEHGLAGRALDPQALGHNTAFGRVGGLDLGRQQFFEPTHANTSRVGEASNGASGGAAGPGAWIMHPARCGSRP